MSDPSPRVLPELPNLRPWTLWAKWSSTTKGTWHPLLFHLIDVATCAEAMWDNVLSPSIRQRIADGMELPLDAARAWVVFLAGLHDIGKACPGFQLQLHLDHIEARLRRAGLKVAPCEWVPHGTVSALALRDILPLRYGVTRPVATALATTLGGHHGVFPTAKTIRDLPEASLGKSSWEAARLRYVEELSDLLGLEAFLAPRRCPHATAIMLGGFVSVVDWLGSDEGIFTHDVLSPDGEPIHDPPAYLAHSREKAHEALHARGWLGWTPETGARRFEELFDGFEPRPLQATVVDLAPRLSCPALVILEAPMGEGKTEAAMYLADAWTADGGQRGMYFALPTQATSNQMFDRVRAFLAHRFPNDIVNLQLLHGHAALSDIVHDLQRQARLVLPQLASIYDTDDHHQVDGSVIAGEWFASGKRALLAPFGVGTVDQSLLAALQVKHFFVRLYGLGAKTLVIDEVHAYDTYMTTLIERLLEWLAALGAPVILLSATLPASRRSRLLQAYARGAGWTHHELSPETSASYPRISWVAQAGAGEVHVPADTSREIALDWVHRDPPSEPDVPFTLGELLRDRLSDGGCCAVICNTVARAQKVYDALKRLFPGDASDGYPLVDLFHARYLFTDRAKREERSLDRFGKTGKRPFKAILVATQVIEQSLDLDFDLLVTDLAPVDLILQRAGRLHRHARSRPSKLATPTLLVGCPENSATGAAPTFDRGSEFVYERYILLKTWLSLQDRASIQTPGDIAALVESVYDGDDTSPIAATDALRAALQVSRDEMLRHQEAEAREAEQRYIKRASPDIDLADLATDPREEDSPELHPKLQALTRLTEPTVQVICLYGTAEAARIGLGGPLAPLKTKPSLEQVRALLGRSVTLSHPAVVHPLLKTDPPRGWKESSLLRQYRVLFFDESGVASVGNACVRLDAELGVVIETPPKSP